MDKVDYLLNEFLNSKEVQNLIYKLYNTNENVFPRKQEIFRAFNLCPLSKTKVVILGQDPYYSKNIADGLAFSTNNSKRPKSLDNIFKEINNENLNYYFPTNSLEHWAKQGVLLLNTSLTVIENKPNSHSKYWHFFTNNIIKLINNNLENVIFVLWGNKAMKFEKLINSKHIILKSAHPSPLSASKGFFGNNHFKKINNILKKQNKTEINWNTK